MESEDAPSFLRYRAQYARSDSLAERFRSVADEIDRLRTERAEMIAALRAVSVDDPTESDQHWDTGEITVRVCREWKDARDSAVALLKRLEAE